jgi:hypothetical protein
MDERTSLERFQLTRNGKEQMESNAGFTIVVLSMCLAVLVVASADLEACIPIVAPRRGIEGVRAIVPPIRACRESRAGGG